MGTGKTYSTKYLLDSNNNSGAAGQVLSTTSTGINWVDANTVPGTGLWLADGNDIYNSNSGNVGIGTTNPQTELHINKSTIGEYLRVGSGGLRELRFSSYNTTSDHAGHKIDASSSNGEIALATGGTARMYIGSTGNIGIGTASPSQILTVRKDSSTTYSSGTTSENTGDIVLQNNNQTDDNFNRISFQSTSSNNQTGDLLDAARITAIYSDHGGANPSGELAFETKADAGTMSEIMRITSDGNVGIGTDDPDQIFVVNQTTTGRYVFKGEYDGTNLGGLFVDGSTNAELFLKASGNVTTVKIDTAGDSYLNGGNVGIGTTSPTSKLQINDGSANITKAMQSGGVDHDFLQLSYAGSWANNVGGLASINFTDNLSSSNTVGRIGVTYTGSQGKFVVTDLYSGGYGASGDVFTIQADGETYIKGNVGIGITSPTQKLHVNGSVRVKEAYYDSSNSAGTSGQVLSSTGSATSWVDGSGLPGGPYLPLAGNTTSTRITGEVYFSNLIPIYWRNSDNTANSFAMLNDANNDMFLINQTGGRHIEIINQATDGDIIFRADSGNGTETEYFRLDGATSKTIFETSTGHKDNVKATFGDGEDLQIYHDGSDSYIKDRGTGDLRIETDGANMLLSDGSHTFIAMNTGASDVVLKQGGNTKLTTKSSGISVSGDISVSGVVHNRDIPCLFNSNFEDAYGTSIKIVPFNNNTEANVSSKTYYHNLTMPYAGKLTKIVMKNVSGTLSSGFTTELFLYVNGSQQANSGEISLSNDSVTWTPTTNNTFSAGDVLSFAYQNSSATKTFGGVSFGVAIELTDYDI